jgi:hypothetical protein
MEDWKYNKTFSGTPQGGIVSPLLANIYLNEFDEWVAKELIPSYTKGTRKKQNDEYHKLACQLYKIEHEGQEGNTRELRKKMKVLPSQDTHDPNYRRLNYVRYADDTLFGYIGTKEEAEEIKGKIAQWLDDKLKLKLSDEKTLITNAQTDKAHFLGYEINVTLRDYQLDSRKSRNSNKRVALRVPSKTIDSYVKKYAKDGKPAARGELFQDSDYDIMTKYQSEYRGIVNYFIMADNVSHLSRLHWYMENSLVHTLAGKHKTTRQKIFDKHKALYDGRHCLEVTIHRESKKPLVARFGAIELKTNKEANISDRINPVYNVRTEIVQRMMAEECEICGSKLDVEVHHVRKLADLKKRYRGKKEVPSWVKHMAARNRKTLMTCRECHTKIHAGKPLSWKKSTGEPDASKGASPVRGGVVSGVSDP